MSMAQANKKWDPRLGAGPDCVLKREGAWEKRVVLVGLRAPDGFRAAAVVGKNRPQGLIQESTVTKE